MFPFRTARERRAPRRRRLAALAVLGAMLAPRPGAADTPPPAPRADSREALERELAAVRAANEALRARIRQLEEMLGRDVCADPAAAEALLNAAPPPAPAATP